MVTLIQRKNLIQIGLFQVGWLICVCLGDVYAIVAVFIILSVHGKYYLVNYKEWFFIIGVAGFGFLLDSIFIKSGVLYISGDLYLSVPVWLPCLWVLFSTTLCHSLFWLRKNLPFAGSIAMIFGPLAYWSGEQLSLYQNPRFQLSWENFGFLQFVQGGNSLLSIFTLSIAWGFILPVLLFVAKKWVIGKNL